MQSSHVRLPLFALLSQTLVAFTIEFDNEFERHAPHRTTRHAAPGERECDPWMVSRALWMKFIRFIPEQGITIRDLKRNAALTVPELRMWLKRLSSWWGVIHIEKSAPEKGDWIVRPTPGGVASIRVWRPLTAIIEARWQERFSEECIAALSGSLERVVEALGSSNLPDCLPILKYDLKSEPATPPRDAQANRTLPGLLAKALLAFAYEFEAKSEYSLAIAANGLRVLGDVPVAVRDLPRLSGVSKEALAMVLDRLENWGWMSTETLSKGRRLKLAMLTPEGQAAKLAYSRLIDDIETRWARKLGQPLAELRAPLEAVVGSGAPGSLLFTGIKPYPGNWRSFVPRPEVLPHFPMVLHRGGYPDGS